MALSRRSFIAAAAGSLLLVALPGTGAASSVRRVCYLSARLDGERHSFLSGLDASGRVVFECPLPGRGHGVALHPGGAEAALVARRPGRFVLLVDVARGRVVRQIESRPDRHFYGHAAFSADGRWLFTSENDYEAGRGVIGVRDARRGYRQAGEFTSFGIEPHDLHLYGDGRLLAVANGGILTHPDADRAELNLDTMAPSLVYLEAETGVLVSQHRLDPELHQLSIRHLAVAGEAVGIAMQYRGPADQRVPLVGVHRPGQAAITLAVAPPEVLRRMDNYCGSACADRSGRWFAVSSPGGSTVTFWSAADGAYAGATTIHDGCGLAAGPGEGEFLLSGGAGDLVLYGMKEGTGVPLQSVAGAQWDNHMLATEPA